MARRQFKGLRINFIDATLWLPSKYETLGGVRESLLGKKERSAEAHTMLAEIYGWFAEGFGTVDLKDAKALLDELSKTQS